MEIATAFPANGSGAIRRRGRIGLPGGHLLPATTAPAGGRHLAVDPDCTMRLKPPEVPAPQDKCGVKIDYVAGGDGDGRYWKIISLQGDRWNEGSRGAIFVNLAIQFPSYAAGRAAAGHAVAAATGGQGRRDPGPVPRTAGPAAGRAALAVTLQDWLEGVSTKPSQVGNMRCRPASRRWTLDWRQPGTLGCCRRCWPSKPAAGASGAAHAGRAGRSSTPGCGLTGPGTWNPPPKVQAGGGAGLEGATGALNTQASAAQHAAIRAPRALRPASHPPAWARCPAAARPAPACAADGSD
jgi:hypothetical protein